MNMNKPFHKNIFKGIITPYRWQDNKVVEISIQTIDEEEYIVDHNDISRDMIQFIYYPVEVSGVIKKRKSDGKNVINVKNVSQSLHQMKMYLFNILIFFIKEIIQ